MVSQRDERGRFVKGASGNPTGRPRLEGLQAIIEAETGDGSEIVNVVVRILRDKEAKADTRLEAATWLADRRWGKPVQTLEHTGADGGPILMLQWHDGSDAG